MNKKVSNTTLTKKWYLMQIAVSNKKETLLLGNDEFSNFKVGLLFIFLLIYVS